jgi:hypothetical protein
MITILTSLWVALAASAIAMWVYATIASYREDDTVHLAAGEEGQIDRQVRNEKRMKTIEKWKTGLSVTTVVSGLVVLGLYLYMGLAHGTDAFK